MAALCDDGKDVKVKTEPSDEEKTYYSPSPSPPSPRVKSEFAREATSTKATTTNEDITVLIPELAMKLRTCEEHDTKAIVNHHDVRQLVLFSIVDYYFL